MEKYRKHAVWAEINVDALRHNFREIKQHVAKGCKLCGVVKANAYGHGAIPYAKYLIKEGVDYLAVARIDEAVELRDAGIKDMPILIFGYVDIADVNLILDYDLTVCAYEMTFLQSLNQAAGERGQKAKVHIKVDTGMGRLGFPSKDETIGELAQINDLANIDVEGIFTHFATADCKDKSYTEAQVDHFRSILKGLREEGLDVGLAHCSNSATIIDLPDYHLDMVRPGIILYGLYPSDEVDKSQLNLRPALTLKTRIALVKTVEAGTDISYGRLFTTKRKSRIATLCVGYADGIDRQLTNNMEVIINGQRAPQVGTICMDQMMVDVTDIEGDIAIGDEAILFGEKDITANDVAAKLGTINYEITCKIQSRVPRIFVNDEGKILQEFYENWERV